jgi:hypothetical protein
MRDGCVSVLPPTRLQTQGMRGTCDDSGGGGGGGGSGGHASRGDRIGHSCTTLGRWLYQCAEAWRPQITAGGGPGPCLAVHSHVCIHIYSFALKESSPWACLSLARSRTSPRLMKARLAATYGYGWR